MTEAAAPVCPSLNSGGTHYFTSDGVCAFCKKIDNPDGYKRARGAALLRPTEAADASKSDVTTPQQAPPC